MVEITLTPAEFHAKVQQLAEQQKIVITGNEGKIEKSGVTAAYRYLDGLLTVTILEKPFFLSTAQCEEQLRRFLANS
jgi:hypothetical protein